MILVLAFVMIGIASGALLEAVDALLEYEVWRIEHDKRN